MNNFAEILDFARSVGQSLQTINAFAQGETVMQGHATICAKFGHGTWTINGNVSPDCPRCGERV